MGFGGSQSIHTEEPRVLSLRVNQSAYGGAKSRVWGKCRIPGNLLDYMDFTAVPHTTTTSSGGGKGGGGVESSNTSYTYTAGVVIGLCVGEIAGIGKIWREKEITTLAALGLTLKSGALQQAVWSHLAAHYPDKAVSYSGIALVANATFDLGSSPNQPNLSFEVFGERVIAGGDDAAPADVIYDIVADPLEGIGLADTVLANLDDYALWCSAMNLTVAVAATSQTPARDLIAQILKATMAEPIWSAGQIKIVPYGDEAIGGWSPNVTPIYDLTESDLLEPPRHKRTQPADSINRVTLNYVARAKDYNTVTITRDDLAAVTQYGPRPESLDLPCIARDEMASAVCEFWRDRGLSIRNQWEVIVDERYCLVEAMDLLTLTFGPQYLDHVPVRVVEVTDDGDGRITLLVEEWPFGLLKPTAIPSQPISGYVPEHAVAPGATNTPVIFEAPNLLTAPNLELWIGASGGEHWGGANVWVSDDGSSYQQVGTITNPARHGVLAYALAAGDDPDTAHTLYLDMSASHGLLQSGTQADADNGNTESWLDGEIVSYQTATLTAADRYSLTYLRRGRQGTVSAGHSAGAPFVRLDESLFKYRVPRERIGSGIWIKLQAYNKYGRSPEPLDMVAAHAYTLSGNKPLALTSLSATGGMFEIGLTWTLQPTARGVEYVEIFGATSNDRANAYSLTSQRHGVLGWKHPGLQPAQTWYYWGRVVDTSGNVSDWYPASATGGIAAAPSADPSALLTQLQKSVGLPQLAAELAAPIVSMPGAIHSQALASIQSALDDYNLTSRMQWQETVTNATVTVDPVSGAIQLLATASVTTDVEARLTAVEVVANADHGTLTSTVASLNTVQGDLTTAQSQITQLQNEVQLGASEVYVDNAINSVAGALTTTAANSLSALAAAEIQSALDLFDQSAQSRQNATSVALANETLQAHADAISAEATARSALVAVLANNIAAVVTETLTRASADASLASSITTLLARLNTGDFASVKTQASATADALGGVEAKWGVQVQTMADGKRALAGIQLLAGTDGESTFAILADKLLIYKPDGTGVPKQIVTLGTVNGTTALGLSGNLIVDGSIVARSLAAKTITAASGVIDDAAIQTAHIGTAVVSDLHIIDGAVTLSAFASDNGYNRFWTAGSFSSATYDDEFSSVSFSTKVGDDITVEAYCYFSTVNASAALDSIYITPHLQVDGADVCIGKRALWRVYDGSNHVAILLKAKISGTGSTRTAKLKVLYDHGNFYNDALGKYRISQCVLSAFIRRR